MQIRRTTLEDLDEIMDIYAHAREFMAANGNPLQWGKSWPSRKIIIKDIEGGNSHVCISEGKIVGVFSLIVGSDTPQDELSDGRWQNDTDYGTVQRIATNGKKNGVGTFCLQWAADRCRSLRMTTRKENVAMLHLLEKNGFEYRGHVKASVQVAYEKII